MFLIHSEPTHKTRGALYITFFNLLVLAFLWSYWSTVFMSAGQPSSVPNLVIAEPVYDGSGAGQEDNDEPHEADGKLVLSSSHARFCLVCKYPKPDRTHHCSTCNRCALKMDHHCVWLNNCVGLGNYKMFMLTLFYGILLCFFLDATILQQLIYDVGENSLFLNEIQLLIAFVLAFLFLAAQIALFSYHVYLSLRNQTTIEALEEKDRVNITFKAMQYRYAQGVPPSPREDPAYNPYDLGDRWANLKAALGQNPWLWLVPIKDRSNGLGIWFPHHCTRKREAIIDVEDNDNNV